VLPMPVAMSLKYVAAGLASKCEVQLSYAIGVARPVSILVETFGTGVDDERLLELVLHFEAQLELSNVAFAGI